MELYINAVLLTLLVVVTLAIMCQQNLFAVVVLFSAYSFLMASIMIVLDAVDVALTEAAVGAGISTVVFLGTLYLTKSAKIRSGQVELLPLIIVFLTGVVLVYGTYGLPTFGVANAPIHMHVAPFYLEQSIPQIGVPNVVTTVLANFRSFDTLGETTVVLTAGIGVMLLLKRRNKKGGDRT